MTRLILTWFFTFVLVASVNGLGIELSEEEPFTDLAQGEEKERLFIIPAVTLNVSALSTALPIALALATSIASIAGTIALAAVVFSLFAKLKHDGGYGEGGYGGGGYGSSGGHTSYSSYRSMFDPYVIDWESFSVTDLIAAGDEIWQKFDPTDFECQKRLICDIHQDTISLGFAAQKIVEIFGYLSYAKVLRLPEELEALVEEMLEAAEVGISKKKDCGDLYSHCEFSVKEMAHKYAQNEI